MITITMTEKEIKILILALNNFVESKMLNENDRLIAKDLYLDLKDVKEGIM